MKKLKAIAKAKGLTLEVTEGGSHTKVKIGDRQTIVARHSEINEMTAKGLLKFMEGEDEDADGEGDEGG